MTFLFWVFFFFSNMVYFFFNHKYMSFDYFFIIKKDFKLMVYFCL